MRVETPQILWHNEGDSKRPKNAALMSVSMLESGLENAASASTCSSSSATTTSPTYGHVLATAGYDNVIHLWKVTLGSTANPSNADGAAGSSTQEGGEGTSSSNSSKKSDTAMFQKHVRTSSSSNNNSNSNGTKFEFLCSLSRHEGPVNAVAFSPDGLHLATAGETGAVLIWSVPAEMRGGGNGRHFWACLDNERQLQLRRVPHNSTSSVQDVSWSADSKRFVAGSYDHAIWVCENANYASSSQEDWRVVYHNGTDHTRHVQGVTYDPTGVYLASMSSDRSVRVYPRKNMTKKGSKHHKALLQPAAAAENGSTTAPAALSPQEQVQVLLRDTKLEFSRSKEIRKLRRTIAKSGAVDENAADAAPVVTKPLLYADETTLGSFVRCCCSIV